MPEPLQSMIKRSDMKRGLVVISTVCVALVFVTPGTSASRAAVFAVNGQNLHIETLGELGPRVVFEAGLGNNSSTWKLVAGSISTFARVVLYDRAGLGQSLPMMRSSSAVTADEVATNLNQLLAAADIRPPYILVGHSLGGLYVQMFAKKYPKEVSGVVLLDSASPDAPSELKTRARLEPGSAAYLEEEGVRKSNEQVTKAGPFPNIPLTVIAATDYGPFFKDWEPILMQLQQRLAKLSPQATLIVAQGSGHDIQSDRLELVINALRQMTAATKINDP